MSVSTKTRAKVALTVVYGPKQLAAMADNYARLKREQDTIDKAVEAARKAILGTGLTTLEGEHCVIEASSHVRESLNRKMVETFLPPDKLMLCINTCRVDRLTIKAKGE